MKLIDKDALVAEIEKLKKSHDNWSCMGKCFHKEYENLLSFIDTLEVKDVDLDFTKEVDMWIENNGDTNGFFNVQDLAEHFYELGLRASQPTTSVYGIEEALKENGIDPDSKEADMYREAIYKIYDRLKAQKGE